MAKTNFQDPQTSEIISPHISGLQEAVGKLEESVGVETFQENGIPLNEVYIAEDDRYRIFQAPAGKRNWLSSPAPVIKKDGQVISEGFSIDYGGGSIVLDINDETEHVYTADATYTKSLDSSFKEHQSSPLPHLIQDLDTGKTYRYGLQIQNGITQFVYEEVV